MPFIAGGKILYLDLPTTSSKEHVISVLEDVLLFLEIQLGGDEPLLFDPFADPYLPIHITQVLPGIELQIAMDPGKSLVVVNTKNGPILAPATKSVRTRGHQKTTIKGLVTANLPSQGLLKISVQDGRRIIPATVKYSDMRFVHRIVRHQEIVETGNRPGDVGYGTKLFGGTLLQPDNALIKVKM